MEKHFENRSSFVIEKCNNGWIVAFPKRPDLMDDKQAKYLERIEGMMNGYLEKMGEIEGDPLLTRLQKGNPETVTAPAPPRPPKGVYLEQDMDTYVFECFADVLLFLSVKVPANLSPSEKRGYFEQINGDDE